MDTFNAFPDVYVVHAEFDHCEFLDRIFTTKALAEEFVKAEQVAHPHYRYRIAERVLFSAVYV